MEVVGAVLGAVVGSVLTCVFNRVGVKTLGEETQTLRDKKEKLIARVNEVNQILRIAEVEHGKTRTNDAQNWLNNADTIIHMVVVTDKEAKVAKICTGLPDYCSPNCCSRWKFQKQILKCVEVMDSLLNEASHFSEESLTFLGMEMPTTRLIGTTADKNFMMIWECIVGDEFEKIGVYGMGGVGKTTIMTEISNQLVHQRSRFQNVLWVTVSRDVDAQKLQKQIAGVVKVDLSTEQDESKWSALLLRALRSKGKFVLILDDLWKAFDLWKLGVPKPTKDNGCKIVWTTRSREVSEGMLCDKDFKIELLSAGEAWELFMENVGEELVSEVEELAKAIVAECCGLPLAIKTIGQAMRKRDVFEWQDALTDLQESTSLNMEEKVIQHLRFSYDQLRENHQKCFLYCALYPEDFKIETSELIEYWVMEGLVKGKNKEGEIRRGHVILNTLKRCCLLEDFTYYVKMHDLIRDMALYITKSNPKFMIRAGYLSKEVPHEDDWSEDLERVSFMYSGIQNIPIIPKCPKLSTLILAHFRRDGPILEHLHIAPGFFMHMNSLTVLDLSWTSIKSLPNSISDLVNLRGLLLCGCVYLVRVPPLSKLQSLRVLKITISAIEELPQGMEMLVNLRSLDLTRNSLNEMIPTGLISKFSLLQELNLGGIAPANQYARERGGDFVQELSSLKHLENLQIQFHDLLDFIAYGELGNFKSLKNYVIAMEGYNYFDGHIGRDVRLSNSKGIPCNALSLPKHTQFLRIRSFNEITNLSKLLPWKDLTDLRDIWIVFCNSIEFIIPEDEEDIFVERMRIESCQSLSKIYEKVPTHGAFPFLKELTIWGCGNIKFLLSSRLLQQLHNLEELDIQNCEQLEELVIADEEESGKGSSSTVHNKTIMVLPRLRTLLLKNSPKLKSTWSRVFMYSNSWQNIKVEGLLHLNTMFSTSLLQHFQNLTRFGVSDCALKELIIAEELVEGSSNNNNSGTNINSTINLPRLEKFYCTRLPNLKSIWKGAMVCDSLRTVTVIDCPELKRLPLFIGEHQSAPPSLKTIEGSKEWWDSLELDYRCPKHLFQEYISPMMKRMMDMMKVGDNDDRDDDKEEGDDRDDDNEEGDDVDEE